MSNLVFGVWRLRWISEGYSVVGNVTKRVLKSGNECQNECMPGLLVQMLLLLFAAIDFIMKRQFYMGKLSGSNRCTQVPSNGQKFSSIKWNIRSLADIKSYSNTVEENMVLLQKFCFWFLSPIVDNTLWYLTYSLLSCVPFVLFATKLLQLNS